MEHTFHNLHKNPAHCTVGALLKPLFPIYEPLVRIHAQNGTKKPKSAFLQKYESRLVSPYILQSHKPMPL